LWFDRNGGLTADRSLADQDTTEYTIRQIRSLVAEIAQLSRSDATEEEFYRRFLPRVVSALAAHSGAIWTTDSDGQLALRSHIEIQKTGLRESPERQAQHGRLLCKILADNVDVLVPPHAVLSEEKAREETAVTNPTDYLLLFGLLKVHRKTIGLVEIFQRPEAGPATQKAYLRFVTQMCELANDFLTELALTSRPSN
jgi:hypothetical protein